MDINNERIRDTLAGAILGAFLAVVAFLLSFVGSVFRFLGGLFSESVSFSPMQGSTFTTLILVLMLVGAYLGFFYGYMTTQETYMRSKIDRWLEKHNR